MSNSTSLLVLKIFAVLTALAAVWQTLVGYGWVSGFWGTHQMVGNITFVLALVAAIAAFLWSRRTGDKGIFMHAAGMALIALVQIALGEMSLRTVHMTLGVLFLVGSIALATLAFRRTAVGHDRRESVEQA